jgi:hypothetical protein
MGEWLLSQRDGRTLALAGRRKNEVEGKQEVRRRSTDAELCRTAFARWEQIRFSAMQA